MSTKLQSLIKAAALTAALCMVACMVALQTAPAADTGGLSEWIRPAALAAAPVTTAVEWDGSEDYGGYRKVSETRALKLFYNEEEDAIQVHDKANGYIWSSMTDWDSYGLEKPNPMARSNTGSMFALVFSDIKANEGKLNKVYTGMERSTRRVSAIDNGISIEYTFPLLQMKVVLEVTLDDDGLKLRIPSDRIEEEERNLLMSLELLPAFGASNNKDSGYILYPDGCGGLLDYANYNNRPNNLTTLSWGVYGPYNSYITKYFLSTGILGNLYTPPKYEASLPVFGVKKGGSAFLAYVSEGEAQCKINISPEGYIVPFNRVSFELQYRNTFEIILSNISAGSEANVKKGIKVDKERMRQDYEMHYVFLNGESADYSGMAQVYRAHLQKTGQLKKSSGATAPLALDLFCGVTEERMLLDKFIAMTTFDNARQIIDALADRGVGAQQVTLKGWSDGGYGDFSSGWSANRHLGGKNGLKDLLQYTKEKGLSLFAQANPILANTENGGFSVRRDAVYSGNGLPFTDSASTLYLMSPSAAAARLMNLHKKTQPFEGLGLALDSIGKYVYATYKSEAKSMRFDTEERWREALGELAKKDRAIALEFGNQYSLAYADHLYNVPIETSHTNISDEQVPFYQMVVHGSIPYTANAGNLFYDERIQKLKWIEFGCLPYYELTYERADKLKFTVYNRLYNSYYENWIEEAAEIYREFNTRLAGTWDSAMTEHVRLSETLVKITYAAGQTVYINYGGTAAQIEGQTVEAYDYLVV